MNVARREVDGTLNPEEPTSAQIFIKLVIKVEKDVGFIYY